jgi:hypothetical protein
MNIVIELKKDINSVTKNYELLNYEPFEVIDVFSTICSIIDEEKIATFGIFLKNGEKISPVMDFKCDFTSIMPELYGVLDVLKRDESSVCELYLYELDKIIYLKTLNKEYIAFSLYSYSKKIKIIEYNILKFELIENIEHTLLKFKNLVFTIFPIAYNFFVKENYFRFEN